MAVIPGVPSGAVTIGDSRWPHITVAVERERSVPGLSRTWAVPVSCHVGSVLFVDIRVNGRKWQRGSLMCVHPNRCFQVMGETIGPGCMGLGAAGALVGAMAKGLSLWTSAVGGEAAALG